MLVVLVVPGVWAPAGVRINPVDADTACLSGGFSRTVAYKKLQDAQVDANTPPKLFKILKAEGIYQPDEGVNQTPGDR